MSSRNILSMHYTVRLATRSSCPRTASLSRPVP